MLTPLRYARAPRPLHFPEEELMPKGKSHLTLRTFLYQLLRFALGPEHSVGSEQLLYWNASNPKRCLAPDVFMKLGVRDEQFGSWKTWERGGVPELAIEIVSPNEDDGPTWDEKFDGYYECGVRELVRFDPNAPEGHRIRARSPRMGYAKLARARSPSSVQPPSSFRPLRPIPATATLEVRCS